jgi:hypothetical protein
MEISGQRQKGHKCMEQRNDGTEVLRVKNSKIRLDETGYAKSIALDSTRRS